MSYRYRRYKSKRSTLSNTTGLITIAICFVLLIGSIAFLLVQYKKNAELLSNLSDKSEQLQRVEKELSILRTLNPYHVSSDEILTEAASNVDLFPGWVARVYPIPKDKNEIGISHDLGSFIMNETRFTLSSHKRYGIVQPNKGMYQLNGLFPSYTAGRLQVGVEFYLSADKRVQSKDEISQIGSCYARIDINQKRVIDKKLHVVTRFSHEQVITGEVEMQKGLFPIAATLYCDNKSDFQGDEVQVSISFRNPGQYNLSTKRNSIFHIYKSDEIDTAKL